MSFNQSMFGYVVGSTLPRSFTARLQHGGTKAYSVSFPLVFSNILINVRGFVVFQILHSIKRVKNYDIGKFYVNS